MPPKKRRVRPPTSSKKGFSVVTSPVTAERKLVSFFCREDYFLRMRYPFSCQGLLGVSAFLYICFESSFNFLFLSTPKPSIKKMNENETRDKSLWNMKVTAIPDMFPRRFGEGTRRFIKTRGRVESNQTTALLRSASPVNLRKLTVTQTPVKDPQLITTIVIIIYLCYVLTFAPAQKCYSKVIHWKEVTHSNGQ